ncbi:TrmB family transcriptional regulator [Nonomuraea sp. MTCD27]|uniref:TrmB family transcriptional regulator n=1 Tax=Nonomuraea sp. MTCD27 TaxID=1676747 RepID=UPI0035C1226A
MLDDDPALEIVGITAFEERVHRAVLASPGITLQELLLRSGESAGRIQSALAKLRAKGLVTRVTGRSPRWTATNPGTALRSLARGVLNDLERLADTADALEVAFQTIGQDPEEAGHFEVLAGPEQLTRWYVRLQQEAEHEVLIFDRPPYVLDYRNPLQDARLRDGVRYRTIYAPEAFQHAGALDQLDDMLESGEHARVLPGLPFKMVLIDRRQAIMPLHLDPPLTRSVLIRGSTMVVALVELFERLWREAVPMYPRPADAPGAPEPADEPGQGEDQQLAELSVEDRRLLALLAAGLKDDAIARQLGMSPRSLRRRLRPLMDALRAETRFQAGAEAHRRGLV